MATRGPKTTENIKREILRLKKINPEITAKEIQQKLKRKFEDSFIPKERAIAYIIQKNKDKTTFDLFDDPWTVGSCIEADISGDIIPILTSIQQKLQQENKLLTIRLARWIAKLYPSLYPILSKECHNDQFRKESRLFECAYLYSISEQEAEIDDILYPNTSVLDDVYFNKKKYFFDMPTSHLSFKNGRNSINLFTMKCQ